VTQAKGKRGRGATERWRGRARVRPTVERSGGHPATPLVPEGLGLRIEAPRSVSGAGRGLPRSVRFAPGATRSRPNPRRGGEGSEGAKTQESNGPVGRSARGASLGARASARGAVDRRTDSRGEQGFEAGGSATAGDARRFRSVVPGRCAVAGQLADACRTGRPEMTIAGSSRNPSRVATPPQGKERRPASGARVKAVGDRRGLRAGAEVDTEPAREQKAV
jgi:hypothetical protein